MTEFDFIDRIKKDLAFSPPKHWLTPMPYYGYWGVARVFGPLIVVIAVSPWLVFYTGSYWSLFLTAPFIGAFAHKITIVMHECGHNSLFANPKMNKAIGHLGGAFLGSDFNEFKRIHWLHHMRLATSDDPQGPDFLNYKEASVFKIIWHLINPLFFQSIYKLILFNFGPRGVKGERDNLARGKTFRYFINRMLLTIALQFLLATLATSFWQLPWLVLLYPAATSTFGLFFSRIRSFCEHISSPQSPGEENVRTHLSNAFDRIMMFEMNFNYHVEHHLFPAVACCHLPEVHAELGRRYHNDDTLSPSIAATIFNRLRQAIS